MSQLLHQLLLSALPPLIIMGNFSPGQSLDFLKHFLVSLHFSVIDKPYELSFIYMFQSNLVLTFGLFWFLSWYVSVLLLNTKSFFFFTTTHNDVYNLEGW